MKFNINNWGFYPKYEIEETASGYVFLGTEGREPHGYCIHKVTANKRGLLTKIELFAYLGLNILETIREKTEELDNAKKGTYPIYFDAENKDTDLHFAVIKWNKSAINVRCYQTHKDYFKIEVTRGIDKSKRGKKFLAPIATLNSLGSLIKFLTKDTKPLENYLHDRFLFVSEFLDKCENNFLSNKLRGQLRLMKGQKLQKNIRFGFKGRKKH